MLPSDQESRWPNKTEEDNCSKEKIKKVDGQAKQKRRIAAKRRLAAGLEMGRLSISYKDKTFRGFQQSLKGLSHEIEIGSISHDCDSALPVCWPHFVFIFIFHLYML